MTDAELSPWGSIPEREAKRLSGGRWGASRIPNSDVLRFNDSMKPLRVVSVETRSLSAMRKRVAGMAAKTHEHEAEFTRLPADNQAQRLEIERCMLDNVRLRLENPLPRARSLH